MTPRFSDLILDAVNYCIRAFSYPILRIAEVLHKQTTFRSTFVTASDFTHEQSLRQMVSSILANRGAAKIVVYDLGLRDQEIIDWLRSQTRVALRPFPFENHPEWYRLDRMAGAYAWKSACVALAASEHRPDGQGNCLVWIDAGCVLTSTARIVETLGLRCGLFANRASGTNEKWTHPTSLMALETHFQQPATKEFREARQPSAALIAFDLGSPSVRQLISEWAHACSIREISFPSGASKTNHRFDQSVLAFAVASVPQSSKVTRSTRWPQSMLGFKVHQDVER